jgi:hypothetical protein
MDNQYKLQDTPDNIARVKALKKINETMWVGNTTHRNLQYSLEAIKLSTGVNSGHYNPVPTRVKGLIGIYMINSNGTLNCEARIIKEIDCYRIEYMTMGAWNDFERMYSEFLNNPTP